MSSESVGRMRSMRLAMQRAIYVLDHPELAERYVEKLRRDGGCWLPQPRSLVYCAHPVHQFSVAPTPSVKQYRNRHGSAERKGYLVKEVHSPAFELSSVTLGPPKIMQGFVEALEAVMLREVGSSDDQEGGR